ncbi:tripartite tricarboxylate transporter substrate binding protein [Ramlibacter sp. AN1015]|uniref:tripartite tricarboxylate transporter substrate binding protein n=1 Tax=Ramlibacter sp. AN1015 TaxID=3133428 RepID=UPI0030BC8376
MIRKLLASGIAAIFGLALAPAASAQAEAAYPTRQVTIVVPTTAGGIADNMARLLGSKLAELWGQPVVVENRAGAGTQIGSEVVARAKPDGYTLMVAYTDLAILPALNPKLRFDVLNDFTRIGKLGSVPAVVLVHPSMKANSLQELVGVLKAEPGRYNFGSGGPGSILQLYGEMFKQAAGVDIVHVPYKGSIEATSALMANQVDIVFQLASANVAQQIAVGKLKGLAASSPARIPTLPDIPTTAEAGLKSFQAGAWYGVFAPAGVPRSIVDKVNADVARVMAMPDVRAKVATLGMAVEGGSADDFDRFFRADHDRWSRTVKAAGIKVD